MHKADVGVIKLVSIQDGQGDAPISEGVAVFEARGGRRLSRYEVHGFVLKYPEQTWIFHNKGSCSKKTSQCLSLAGSESGVTCLLELSVSLNLTLTYVGQLSQVAIVKGQPYLQNVSCTMGLRTIMAILHNLQGGPWRQSCYA